MIPSWKSIQRDFSRKLRTYLRSQSREDLMELLANTAFRVCRSGIGIAWNGDCSVEEAVKLVYEGKSFLRLLYVEDDFGIAKSVTRGLSDPNFEIVHVKSSREALNKLEDVDPTIESTVFDLVLTDWNLIASDTGAPVVRQAQTLGLPVRVFSGVDPIPEFKDIWILKSRFDEVEEFIRSVREVPSRA